MAVDFRSLETKWQKKWADAGLGKAQVSKSKEKFMMIFAYPGISGYLHVGHMRGFTYTDAVCRYERMQGKEVLFPIGTHASGNVTIAFASKVKKQDEVWLEYLKKNGCSKEQIQRLITPEAVIKYFNEVYVNDYWKKFGFLCDWDRFTSTSQPDYEKFIQWQFLKLQKKDLLTQKLYFATACLNCGPVAVDASETDISKGGNAEKTEYTLLKFKMDDGSYLVAATLRPETIFGQTNLWMNPDAKYVQIQVGNKQQSEQWILSSECASKIIYQKENIIIESDINPKDLIGKSVLAPGVNRTVPIFPATFCDPTIGTGIVTSVPSHAPMDWIALQDLKNDKETCDKFGIDIHEVWDTQPISIITIPGFGDHPAGELIEKLKIETQHDIEKLEEAKKEIYKTEFHTGVMKPNCQIYTGKRVEEAKELVKATLLAEGKADVFYDLSEEVICRCEGKVIIKRIDDQWFIKYSDPELTERSKEQAREMKIHPKEYYDNLPSILDWFSDRACARLGSWIGSKMPFDPKWIIEPISDSTLYPVYYIVSKWVNNKTITTEELTEEFFDFVFLAKGKGKSHWKQIQEEFEYFYPLDFNLGGKEHQTVHFPVFIMNHVAILPEHKWPRGIIVNWWVTGKGSKISKSKGGAEPIPDAIKKYGVDSMRLYYGHIGSPHVDVVWDESVVFNYKSALERIYTICEELHQKSGKECTIDHWLLSRMHTHIKSATESMQEYNLRDMAGIVYFLIYDDIRWYVRRGGCHKKTIATVIDIWAHLLCPLTPHLAEELFTSYASINNQQLCSSSSWPESDEKMISRRVEQGERMIREVIENIRTVSKLAKIEDLSTIHLFVAQKWLSELVLTVQKELKKTRNIGEIMRVVLEHESLKGYDISKIVLALVKDPSKIPPLVLTATEEYTILSEAILFFAKEFSSKIEIVRAEDSTHPKAVSAMPGKPGIVVE